MDYPWFTFDKAREAQHESTQLEWGENPYCRIDWWFNAPGMNVFAEVKIDTGATSATNCDVIAVCFATTVGLPAPGEGCSL
jgi:hypothetical protein